MFEVRVKAKVTLRPGIRERIRVRGRFRTVGRISTPTLVESNTEVSVVPLVRFLKGPSMGMSGFMVWLGATLGFRCGSRPHCPLAWPQLQRVGFRGPQLLTRGNSALSGISLALVSFQDAVIAITQLSLLSLCLFHLGKAGSAFV